MVENMRLTFDNLLDLVEGRLTAVAQTQLLTELQSASPEVHAEWQWLQAFHQLQPHILLANPPQTVQKELGQLFAAYAQAHRPPSLWQQIVATLTFDSRLSPAMAGIRSAATLGLERQLVYSSPVADVTLNIQPESEHIAIYGQIFPTEETAVAYHIQLLQNGLEQTATVTDELGEFTLTDLSPGIFDLIITAEQFEMSIALLDLCR